MAWRCECDGHRVTFPSTDHGTQRITTTAARTMWTLWGARSRAWFADQR
jgi:hypothetical protein